MRARYKRAQLLAAFFGLEVQRHGSLVAVQRHIDRAHIGIRRIFAAMALAVALWPLDFDDVRAEIAQRLRGVRAENEFRQVDDRDAGQRPMIFRHGLVPIAIGPMVL